MPREPLDPPSGCQVIPGFIAEIARGGPWLTKDGSLTTVWSERGVWATTDEAAAVISALTDETEGGSK